VAKLSQIFDPWGMNDLNQYYCGLLGLSNSWNVGDIDLDLPRGHFIVSLSHAGGDLPGLRLAHPESGHGSGADMALAEQHDVRSRHPQPPRGGPMRQLKL
jgi:hypothetical protein